MNIRDIAKKAGVSVATISRYLNPKQRQLVNLETQRKIEKIVQHYQYVPNRAAQALSRLQTDTIGMVTPFSTDVVKSPYFEGLIAGIIEGIRPLNYDLKWVMIRDEQSEGWAIDRLLQKHAVDGLIFLSWRLNPNLVREIENSSRIPAVLINDYQEKLNCSIVYADNKSGVNQICSYLVSKKYKKIGIFRGPEELSCDMRERYFAFKACERKMGFVAKESHCLMADRLDGPLAHEITKAQFAKKDIPDAMFCVNDDLAHGMLRALKEMEIAVPGEIAVVGYDDGPRNEMISPFLTSVRQPTEAMGRASVEILSNLISKRAKAPVQLRFEPELMIRESA